MIWLGVAAAREKGEERVRRAGKSVLLWVIPGWQGVAADDSAKKVR